MEPLDQPASPTVKVFCDAHLYCLGREQDDVRAAISAADECYADGRSVRILTGWEYCTGSEYFEKAFSSTGSRQCTHYFYGANERVLASLTRRVVEEYGAEVVGFFCPPSMSTRSWPVEETVRKELEATDVDYFWVFLGGGKQEVWAQANKSELRCREILCVGAVAEFFTGEQRRAPEAFRRLGLEWLHRTLFESRARARRNAEYLLKMCYYLGAHWVGRGKRILVR